MAFLTFLVLFISCWVGASLSKTTQASHGNEGNAHVSVAINPHGPHELIERNVANSKRRITRRDTSAQAPEDSEASQDSPAPTPSQWKAEKEAEREEAEEKAKEQADEDVDGAIVVYNDTECSHKKQFGVDLEKGQDWSDSCRSGTLHTSTESRFPSFYTHPGPLEPDPQATEADSLVDMHPMPTVRMKITCDEGGTVLIYSEKDSDCTEYTTRYILDANQASQARGGACLTATKDKGESEEEGTAVGVMFTNIDDDTVFPQCFADSSIPLPGFITDMVGEKVAMGIAAVGCFVCLVMTLTLCAWCHHSRKGGGLGEQSHEQGGGEGHGEGEAEEDDEEGEAKPAEGVQGEDW